MQIHFKEHNHDGRHQSFNYIPVVILLSLRIADVDVYIYIYVHVLVFRRKYTHEVAAEENDYDKVELGCVTGLAFYCML